MAFQSKRSAAIAALLLCMPQYAYSQVILERAGLFIIEEHGKAKPAVFTEEQLNSEGMVCIRFNNYWCIKAVGWKGEIGRDSRGHAIFDDPVYAARAVARQFWTWWNRDKRRTAFDIMSVYAPPDDCVGSIGKPPKCKYGLNPTEAYAAKVAEAVQKGPHDMLDLFDDKGRMNRNVAIPLMQAIAKFEITDKYRVSPDIIGAGIEKAGF